MYFFLTDSVKLPVSPSSFKFSQTIFSLKIFTHFFLSQVAVVDRELGILGEEREQNSRKLNLKRVQHVTTLQQLGKGSF
jgi:hypothetical protein